MTETLKRRFRAYQRLLLRRIRPILVKWGLAQPTPYEEIEEGVLLRVVRRTENIAVFCPFCEIRILRESSRDGGLIELSRKGQSYAFVDEVSSTNCRHCHRPIPMPAVYSIEEARQRAEEALPEADYVKGSLVRIEPRNK